MHICGLIGGPRKYPGRGEKRNGCCGILSGETYRNVYSPQKGEESGGGGGGEILSPAQRANEFIGIA